MAIEVPKFLATVEVDQVVVSAEPHPEQPAVLFEMLGATTLRAYNTINPKEENMYLHEMDDRPDARLVVTDLPLDEAAWRMQGLILDFESTWADLGGISARQLEALIDHAQNRLRTGSAADESML